MATLTDNLIAYWKLDESSGNATDSVGSNTATNTSTTFSTGKINNGAVFNGSSSKLTTTSNYSLGTGDFTISLWFKKAANTGNMGMFTSRDGDITGFTFGWGASDNKPYATIRAVGSDDIVTYGTAITDTNWHHIVATRVSGTLSLYVDNNTPVTTSSSKTMNGSGNFTFGVFRALNPSGDNFFNGSLDECGIWSRGLSSTEVSTIYNGGTGKQYPFSNSAGFLSLL